MNARVLALAFVAATSAGAAVDPVANPEGWLRAFDGSTVAAEGWSVENLRVELAPAHLDLESGTLIPVRGPSSPSQEFLFIGRGRFVLATDDPVEAYQLELFTAHDQMDEQVTRAVFAMGADAAATALASRPGAAPLPADRARAAAELLAAWKSSREYRRSGLRLNALGAAAGDPRAQRYAAAWCEGATLGRFLFDVDPAADDAVSVVQFVPARIGDAARDSWMRWLRAEHEEGRRLGTEMDDFGNWDTWYASPASDRASFEPDHYDLEMTVSENLDTVEGKAVLDLTTQTDRARVVSLSLLPDLAIDSIATADGRPLRWARAGDQIAAVLPAAASAGEKLKLAVVYHGVLFERTYDNRLVKTTTQSWYPKVGAVDRATYKLAIDVPEPLTLIGSGRKVQDASARGWRRQVRVLDKPSEFFGFEIGKYKIVERSLGRVALEIGFLSDARTASDAEREQTIATISEALGAYEESFGPYPLDTLAVATTLHPFAQGFLGFVTLAEPVVQNIDESNARGLDMKRIVAHELGHQWWGNLVGWSSYRDVWLSESLANYAAAVYRRKVAERSGARTQSAYLDLISSEEALGGGTMVDRPVEAMGPITLGARLQSSLSEEAYHAVVYQKGAMVLALLAEQLGEEPFLAMLKEIAQRARFRKLDTNTVFAALGKMSGRDLAPFVRGFVRGVGYPEIHYDYGVEAVEGGFVVRGKLRQIARGYRRDRLVGVGDGAFDEIGRASCRERV